MSDDAVLCYINGPWAYFTTKPLDQQWGDDWNDAPYEHNAGEPYEPCWHRSSEERMDRDQLCGCTVCERDWDGAEPRWRIVKVAWSGPFETPHVGHSNSPFSVEQINAGAAPWLSNRDSKVFIPAGTTLARFRERIRAAGGDVYERVP